MHPPGLLVGPDDYPSEAPCRTRTPQYQRYSNCLLPLLRTITPWYPSRCFPTLINYRCSSLRFHWYHWYQTDGIRSLPSVRADQSTHISTTPMSGTTLLRKARLSVLEYINITRAQVLSPLYLHLIIRRPSMTPSLSPLCPRSHPRIARVDQNTR